MKIHNTPFPFPFSQMLKTILIFYVDLRHLPPCPLGAVDSYSSLLRSSSSTSSPADAIYTRAFDSSLLVVVTTLIFIRRHLPMP